MEFRTLRAFAEVVRQGGFSQAAKVVFTTQSTISKAVKQLEDELGVPLLDRVGHQSRLTAAGELVYRRALRILVAREDMLTELQELRGLKRGTLRLGLPPYGSDTLFAPVFALYRSRYPGIDIRLIELGGERLEDILLAGEIELGASLLPVSEAFEFQDVVREPLVVLFPLDHEFACSESIACASLKDLPHILLAPGFALNRVVLDLCQRRGYTPRIAARSSQLDFVVELVASGVGVALLPRMIAERRSHAGVRSVPLAEPDAMWRMAMIWRRGGYLSCAAKAWLELTRESDPPTPIGNPLEIAHSAAD